MDFDIEEVSSSVRRRIESWALMILAALGVLTLLASLDPQSEVMQAVCRYPKWSAFACGLALAWLINIYLRELDAKEVALKLKKKYDVEFAKMQSACVEWLNKVRSLEDAVYRKEYMNAALLVAMKSIPKRRDDGSVDGNYEECLAKLDEILKLISKESSDEVKAK